jgi:hypothetical protein
LRALHFYFDGYNGQQTGEHVNGSVDDCVTFLLDNDTDSGQYDPENEDTDYHSINDWTPEEAKEALLEALSTTEVLYLGGGGGRMSWLSVTED